ncbi:MAG: HEPN domain-containing protein [Bryobacteraceae bacterium]|nr:HEPN domain-containing protein [Bryobacteraceae bacterium]
MSVRPELAEVLRQWVRKAEHDLEAARRIMAVEEGCPFDAACFHCQQAVEKYLKALLTLEGIPAPRTHDLEQLILLIPESGWLEVPVSTLAAMNPYAVEVRYADDWREPQLADAVSALEVAQRVRVAVRRILPDEVLDLA